MKRKSVKKGIAVALAATMTGGVLPEIGRAHV